MDLTIVRGDNAAVLVGGEWVIEFFTTDDCYLSGAYEPTVVVTLPDGTSDTPVYEDGTLAGYYLLRIPITQAGRHVATVSSLEIGTSFITAEALTVSTEAEMPTAGDVLDYLTSGGQSSSFSEQQIESFLASERAAQARRCRIPASYPPDLRMALLRRVQRAMAMKGIVYDGETTDFDGGTTTFRPTSDPEIRRLEAPYRKVILG